MVTGNTIIGIEINGTISRMTWAAFAGKLSSLECRDGPCPSSLSTSLDVSLLVLSVGIPWILLMRNVGNVLMQYATFQKSSEKSSENLKNMSLHFMLQFGVSAIVTWSVGYALAFGDSSMTSVVGLSDFFLLTATTAEWITWLLHWARGFSVMAIVMSVLYSRISFRSATIVTIAVVGVLYPVIVHAAWTSGGWASSFSKTTFLLSVGVLDYGGSAIIHVTAGTIAAVAVWFFPKTAEEGDIAAATSSSPLCRLVGLLFLWGSWYGFNGASPDGTRFSVDVFSRVVVNTTLSAAMGGFLSGILSLCDVSEQRLRHVGNGILIGLIASAAGCATVESYAMAITGALAGILYQLFRKLCVSSKWDEPLDIFSTHFVGGIWGTIAAALFSTPKFIYEVYAREGCSLLYPCPPGGSTQLGDNVLFLTLLVIGTALFSILLFTILKIAGEREKRKEEESFFDREEEEGHFYPKSTVNSNFLTLTDLEEANFTELKI